VATQGIDFVRLGLRDALDLAILVEEEACERYGEFADQMELHHTPDAAGFFRVMAANEEKHRLQLATRRRARFADAPVTVTRAMLFDVEAPDYDEVRVFMSARAALEAALRAEEKAHAFFDAALGTVADSDVRALFTELRADELVHQGLVRDELAKLPPADPFADEDLADEPVAHD
jgi:rubrerythrin